MSTSTSSDDALSVYDDETVQLLIDKVEDLEATVADQAGRIGELEDEVEAKDEKIEQLERRIEDNRDEIEAVDESHGENIAGCHSRINAVEEEIDELEETDGRAPDSSADNSQGIDEETTALEQVCALPEHVVEDQLTANQRRARSVARRIEEYGRKVPAGIAITSSRIKRVLTAQEDATIHRQTVSRVADFLERFGDGQVQIKETRGGKTTVVFDEDLVDAVTGVVTDQEASSVTPAVV